MRDIRGDTGAINGKLMVNFKLKADFPPKNGFRALFARQIHQSEHSSLLLPELSLLEVKRVPPRSPSRSALLLARALP